MKNYTVGPGDTISRIILREYAIDAPNWSSTLMDCMIRYISVLNGKDLALYDNIDSHNILDPDSLKPNQVLIIPDSIAEAAADPKFKAINNNACGALFNTADAFIPAKKNNKYLWWIGGGLIALGAIYFLTKKKKGKHR
jgi:hypothetical protein